LSEPDEKSFGPPDVAEPVHVVVLDYFADEFRAVLAEPSERLVDVVDGEHDAQVAESVHRVGPGEPMAMYHWEADQEDFLVVSGEALLIVEGEERGLRAWDFVHCPPETKHAIVGAGDEPCVVVAVGARDRTRGEDWGGYTVDGAALRHLAGVEEETDDPKQAYARFPASELSRYREGWLPDLG
jgi:uncharacterized cupin superfamily protein